MHRGTANRPERGGGTSKRVRRPQEEGDDVVKVEENEKKKLYMYTYIWVSRGDELYWEGRRRKRR